MSALTLGSTSAALRAREVGYRSMDGQSLSLLAHFGRRVVLLVPPERWDPATLGLWVETLDRAWDAYRLLTGTQPDVQPGFSIEGRATFAVVPGTCGAACGYLGHTGIEIATPFFRQAHDRLKQRGVYDQAAFYEIGRNFWRFDGQLGPLKAMVTGFAIANRFLSMRLAEAPGADFNGWEFRQFENAVAQQILPYWLAQPTRSWRRDIAQAQWPTPFEGSNGVSLGAADLAAAILLRIRAAGGYAGYRAFWDRIAALPNSLDAEAARDRLMETARTYAGLELGAVFRR